MLLKVTEKVFQTVTLGTALFIVCTVTVTVHCSYYYSLCIRLLLLLLSPHRPSILRNMDID